jgi:hypothetical protein
VPYSAEENLEEDDEEGRWMRIMQDLKDREASGESLSDEQITLLETLENRRIKVLENLIEDIKKKGNLQDKELLQVNLHSQEKTQHLLD